MVPLKNEGIWSNPDLLVRSGSHLYGCSTPTSDVDLRGFVVEPGEYLLGRKKFEQYEDKEDDTIIWGFAKFFELLEKGSPNTFEILFAPASEYIVLTDKGRMMVENRHLFVCRQVTDTIRGFASSEWLKAQLLTRNKETDEVYHSSRVVGAKRKESHAEFGYSVKNAYHSIRLLEQGIELLERGDITFPRPNADLLRSIRNGEIKFEDLAALREKRTVEFATAEEKTSLPKRANREKIDNLYFEIIDDRVEEFLRRKGRTRVIL
jgi:uncharacterized protein